MGVFTSNGYQVTWGIILISSLVHCDNDLLTRNSGHRFRRCIAYVLCCLVGRWLSFRSFFIAFVCCPHWYCWFDCHLTGIAVVIICTVRSLTGYVVRLLFPHCFYFRPRNLCLHSWPSAECMFIAVLNTGCRSQFFFAPVSAWSFNWWAVAIDGY